MKIDKRRIRRIVPKVVGVLFILFSLGIMIDLILHGKERCTSAVPAIDWMWYSFKCGFGLFIGIALLRADPEVHAGVRLILKFLAAIWI